MTFWRFWDLGGNWLLFTLAFLAIEFTGIYNHRYTLSETFWLFLKNHEVLAVFALVTGLTALVGHFLANWWRG